jgi:ArsR family transcriptional regulator
MQSDALQVWKADFFKALAHPARIRILEHLRDGEKSAGEILEALGLEQSNGSQHLAVLRNKDILVTRREGTSILYSVRDPMLYEILDLLRRYFYEHLSEIRGLLEALDDAPTLVGADGSART